MSQRVLFRTDGGPSIGGGHVMRCLALANAFAEKGWSIGFASSQETFKTMPQLSGAGYESLVLSGEIASEAQAMAERWRACDLLIVDHYGRDAGFEAACRGWAKRILVIDDLADRSHDADLLIDGGAEAPTIYKALVPANCEVLVGPSYAIVSPAFLFAREAALPRRDGRSVARILVSLGQVDPDNATALALDAIELSGYSGAVDVVLGQSAPHLSAIRRRAKNRITLHVNASNMPALMATSDLSLGAGGVTAFERCCLGLPSILVQLAENQRQIIMSIAAAGAGTNAGQLSSMMPAGLAEHLRQLLASGDQRRSMSASAARLVDGNGIRRIAEAALANI